MTNNDEAAALRIGDTVTVHSPGHRKDGCVGTVSYLGKFWGTVGVAINGEDYGFFPVELTRMSASDARAS